jgi:hypothetical protein
MGESLLRAPGPGSRCSGEYLFNDGRNISSIVDPSVIDTQPNQSHRLYRLPKTFRMIVL